jgi:hypothetical protein
MTSSTPPPSRRLLLLLLLPPLIGAAPAGGRTILLVDDHDVLYRSGTRRVLHPPARHPANPLIQRDKPWEAQIAWNSVWCDPKSGKYQLWYQAWNTLPPARGESCVVAYAESDDGIHFKKPQLDLSPFEGHAKTNIVLVGNGGHSYRYSNSVLVDPSEADASRRYKMAYFDWAKDGGQEYPGLCVAFSPDGVHWTKHPKAPLSRIAYVNYEEGVPFADEATTRPWAVPLSMADAVDVCFDPKRNVYAWYGKMWIDSPVGATAWKHGMGRCESRDLVNWSRPQLVATPDDRDAPHVEFHTSPVFVHAGVYFCLNQILNRGKGEGVIDVELMTSRDGLRWERNFRDEWFIPRNKQAGAFDSGSVFTNATPVILDDEIRFYYGGYAHGATGADQVNSPSGVGLATIPRDRFAGVRPVERSDQGTLKTPLEHVGQVTLKPIDLGGASAITVNADARDGGEVRVELLDEAGRRVRGFSFDDAAPIRGDSLRHRVAWKNKSLSDLTAAAAAAAAGAYHLRIHLRRATLYAVSISPNS